MTFVSAPWALDGARAPAALARTASYTESGGAEGVVASGDLKVSALGVPGPGIQIAGGGALLLNRHQASPSETYTILNSGTEVLDASDMPAANAAARSHLVCVTIGDPEFSAVGHPWMTGSDPAAGTEETFQYVRPFVIANVPANTKSFKELGLAYPALALARIDVPANTSTITSGMIVDLRKIARPRREEAIVQVTGLATKSTNPAADVDLWVEFGSNGGWSVEIPEWATRANVMGFLEGVAIAQSGAAYGEFRPSFPVIGSAQATVADWTVQGATFEDRFGVNLGSQISIPANIRGSSQPIRIEHRVLNAASTPMRVDNRSTAFLRIAFEEAAI